MSKSIASLQFVSIELIRDRDPFLLAFLGSTKTSHPIKGANTIEFKFSAVITPARLPTWAEIEPQLAKGGIWIPTTDNLSSGVEEVLRNEVQHLQQEVADLKKQLVSRT